MNDGTRAGLRYVVTYRLSGHSDSMAALLRVWDEDQLLDQGAELIATLHGRSPLDVTILACTTIPVLSAPPAPRPPADDEPPCSHLVCRCIAGGACVFQSVGHAEDCRLVFPSETGLRETHRVCCPALDTDGRRACTCGQECGL